MTRALFRTATAVAGLTALFGLAACSDGGGSSKVASLAGANDQSATTTTVNSQEAMLAYAACMRENGVDMQDPTFDANGNITGGGVGGSGIDPRDADFQTAQTACGSLIQGIDFGGNRGGAFDRDAIQSAMNDFTACLRDQGLDVDDITFGAGGGGGPNGGAPGGSIPVGNGGSLPPGGFGGGPNGTPPAGGAQGPGGGGAGFDPTAQIIERLCLDDTDPAVTAALDSCQSIITDAFQPTSTTAG